MISNNYSNNKKPPDRANPNLILNDDEANRKENDNLSQETTSDDDTLSSSPPVIHSIAEKTCNMCKRVLKSVAGLKNHQRTCLSKTTIINQTNKNKNENNIINLSHSQIVNNINNIAISAENHALTSHITVISETNVMPKIHHDIIHSSQPVLRELRNDTFTEIKHEVNNAYEHIVKWRRNMFTLPKGHAGKLFVKEMSNLINAWCHKTEWREISLKSLMILPSLLLQKASPKSKSSENKEMLERRLKLWQNGQITDLLRESSTIQSRLPARRSTSSSEETAKKFTNFIINGNINGALRLLENNEGGCGILPINDSTIKLLHEKHPDADEFFDDMLLNGPRKYIDPIVYETINADMIEQLSIKTKEAAGPSKFDADDWKRILGTKLYGS